MISIRFILTLTVLFSLLKTTVGQDKLLLTNGKIKSLTGVVVHYDHDDVLWQNAEQRDRMEAYKVRKSERELSKRQDPRWIAKQEKKAQKGKKQKEKKLLKLQESRQRFETEIKERMERLSPADFEKWKNRELSRLQALEKNREFEVELDKHLEDEKAKKKEARELAKFTKRVPRDLVFSILKNDTVELVVYSADTLGFLSDGEPEVEYGVAEMRMYIKGRQDGRKHKVLMDALIGVGVGTVSSFLGAYWGPIVPAAYVTVMTIANTKVKNKAGIPSSLLDDPAYRDGYERSAKNKKVWSFVTGSAGGLVAGFIMWQNIFR